MPSPLAEIPTRVYLSPTTGDFSLGCPITLAVHRGLRHALLTPPLARPRARIAILSLRDKVDGPSHPWLLCSLPWTSENDWPATHESELIRHERDNFAAEPVWLPTDLAYTYAPAKVPDVPLQTISCKWTWEHTKDFCNHLNCSLTTAPGVSWFFSLLRPRCCPASIRLTSNRTLQLFIRL